MAITAAINNTAVKAFIEAYIGGKKVKGSTSKPKSFKLTPNKAATAKGITIDKAVIIFLYFFSVG